MRDLCRAFGTSDRDSWTESQRRVVMRLEWLEKTVKSQPALAERTFSNILKAVRCLVAAGFEERDAIHLILAQRRERGL